MTGAPTSRVDLDVRRREVAVLAFDLYGTLVDRQGGLTEARTPLLRDMGWTGRPHSFVTWWRRASAARMLEPQTPAPALEVALSPLDLHPQRARLDHGAGRAVPMGQRGRPGHHGCVPAIAGRGIANPAVLVLCTAMLPDWLGDRHADGPHRGR